MKLPTLATCFLLALSSSHLLAADSLGIGEKEFTISGFVDGRDEFAFTPGKITWTHKYWGEPRR